jgi:CheY-like chemotaxis protein/HPt (histidine-containing phosphotransfer) domain-containing protein
VQKFNTLSPFDLVLMDWKMPGMDGIETIKNIQEKFANDHVPMVMMVTAFDREQLKDETSDINVHDILVKPVNQSMLLNTILRAFGQGAALQPGNVSGHARSHTLSDKVRGASLLLVEDNEINQQVASEILSRAGLHVTIANNGSEALDILFAGQHHFDGILMDIQMPILDGYQTTIAIRQRHEYDQLPIIAMTANAFSTDREQAFAAGMNEHIAKPINVEQLFKVLEQLVSAANPQVVLAEQSTRNDNEDIIPAVLELPGFNIEMGLKRLAGNQTLYQQLLKRFYQDEKDVVELLQSQLADKALLDKAHHSAHTLKGVAGNLGAEKLFEITRELDAQILNNRGVTSELWQQFKQTFDEVYDGLGSWIKMENEQDSESNSVEPVNNEIFRQKIDQLKLMLRDSDAEAADLIEEIKKQITNEELKQVIAEISELVSEFDFDSALEKLSGVDWVNFYP